jgi:hypothetical protein
MICYGIKLPDDARIRYVGQTRLLKERRFEQHLSSSRRMSIRTPLSKWLRKHPNAVIIELGTASDETSLDSLECQLIAQYRSLGQADLNVKDGGKVSSDEFRLLQVRADSAKLKRALTDSTEETKKRRREAQRVARSRPGWREKQSESQKKAHGTAEARARTSQLTKAGMTEDVKRHLREVFSLPEVRARRSAAQRARREREKCCSI